MLLLTTTNYCASWLPINLTPDYSNTWVLVISTNLRFCYLVITIISLKVILPHQFPISDNQSVYKHLKI
jgi:hypothetical protein